MNIFLKTHDCNAPSKFMDRLSRLQLPSNEIDGVTALVFRWKWPHCRVAEGEGGGFTSHMSWTFCIHTFVFPQLLTEDLFFHCVTRSARKSRTRLSGGLGGSNSSTHPWG
jgi:hypothetical protein